MRRRKLPLNEPVVNGCGERFRVIAIRSTEAGATVVDLLTTDGLEVVLPFAYFLDGFSAARPTPPRLHLVNTEDEDHTRP